jgi:hypothetical protein
MLSLILAGAAASGLTLTARVASDRVLVGEPVRIEVALSADPTTYLPGDVCDRGNELAAGTLVVLRDGPGGAARYRERLVVGDSVTQTFPTAPGGTCTVDLTLVYGTAEGAAAAYFLPVPGDYTLRVDYRGTVSAPVNVHAEAPTGAEAEVFTALQGDPFSIQYGNDEVSQSLLGRFPRSRYLTAARLSRLDRRIDRVHRGLDPDSGQLVTADQQQTPIFVREQSRRLADELLSEDWGATEDVKLRIASDLARRSGDDEWADRIASDLTSRLPRSPGARQHLEDRARDSQLAAARAQKALARADLWEAGEDYSDGDVVRYDGAIYVCTRDHVAVNGQPPSSQPSLWRRR